MRLMGLFQNLAIPMAFFLLGLYHFLKTDDWVLFAALGLNGVILGMHDFAVVNLIEIVRDLEEILFLGEVGKNALDSEHPKNS